MRFSQHIKKGFIVAGIAVPLCFMNIANLRAADSGSPDYLAIIAKNTTDILAKVNGIPDYLDAMGKFILSWMAPEKSPTIAKMQENFDLLGQVLVQNPISQIAGQKQVMADIVGKTPDDFIGDTRAPILTAIPNINDLSYASLLGSPPAAKGPFSAYNYIKNASGVNIRHIVPRPDWSKTNAMNPYQQLYYQYFNTITAIESFSAYVLSNAAIESQNGGQSSSALQDALVTQASASTWIAEIGSEELGKVLRQILVFQSQTYVLLTQLVQTQKQQLTATVMTNSLLILNNRINENYLAARAQGIAPTA